MTKLNFLFSFLLICSMIFAQAPNKMSYQAVIRNSSNDLVSNQVVSMQISILQGTSSGNTVYVELQSPSTNANGLVSIEIGAGTVVSGNFSTIDWANGPYFIKTETDPTGGSNYSITGTSQLLSVPYALYAETSGSSIPGPQGPSGLNGQDGVSITSSYVQEDSLYVVLSNGQTLNTGYVRGQQGPIGFNGLNGQDGVSIINSYVQADSLFVTLSNGQILNTGYVKGPQGPAGNDEQQLSVSQMGDTLYLQNGGFVIIPGISAANQPPNIALHSCGADSVHNNQLSYNNLFDIDGNHYKTIIIGTQEWMAENLKVSHYQNGDLIPVVTGSAWSNLTTGLSCWYLNDSATYDCPYGKLYNWYTVVDPRNVCPSGWHVPSNAEWSTLINFLDPNADGGNIQPNTAGSKLKSSGTQYWLSPNSNTTNISGFSGLPGGYRSYNTIPNFFEVGSSSGFWSSTEYNSDAAMLRWLFGNNGTVQMWDPSPKKDGFSVRCIKD